MKDKWAPWVLFLQLFLRVYSKVVSKLKVK